MPIIIAMLLHKLGHYFPVLIIKKRFIDLRAEFKLRQIFFELTGTLMNFVIAFLLVSIITLSSKEKYLLNKNAVYGIEVSELAKELGFKSGDKIIKINNKNIERFNDILPAIILETGDVEVIVQDNISTRSIKISNIDKSKIIQNKSKLLIVPKLRPDSIYNSSVDYLKYEERQKGFADIFKEFGFTLKMTTRLISSNQADGFIVPNINNLIGFLYAIASSSILIGLLNLLPLPGLDIGNAIIILIELKRKSKFNVKRLRIIRIISSSLIIILLALVILS